MADIARRQRKLDAIKAMLHQWADHLHVVSGMGRVGVVRLVNDLGQAYGARAADDMSAGQATERFEAAAAKALRIQLRLRTGYASRLRRQLGSVQGPAQRQLKLVSIQGMLKQREDHLFAIAGMSRTYVRVLIESLGHLHGRARETSAEEAATNDGGGHFG